ncbi:Uma2 family endonuclease [soil metagenome]
MTETKVKTEVKTEIPPVVLRMRPALDVSDDELLLFSGQNKDLRIERTAEGDLEVMPPTGGERGNRNIELTSQLQVWTKQNDTGAAFDSSSGFRLPNGAVRAPDAAWVRSERLSELAAEQKRKFIPLCPDFVIELCSPTDSLAYVQAKMDEYIENGARLGWLIDPDERKVHVYRPDETVRVLENSRENSGDPILPGFTLDLRRIWEPRL